METISLILTFSMENWLHKRALKVSVAMDSLMIPMCWYLVQPYYYIK